MTRPYELIEFLSRELEERIARILNIAHSNKNLRFD